MIDDLDHIRQQFLYRSVDDLIREAEALEKQATDWVTMGFPPNGNAWQEVATRYRQVADERINGRPVSQPVRIRRGENP